MVFRVALLLCVVVAATATSASKDEVPPFLLRRELSESCAEGEAYDFGERCWVIEQCGTFQKEAGDNVVCEGDDGETYCCADHRRECCVYDKKLLTIAGLLGAVGFVLAVIGSCSSCGCCPLYERLCCAKHRGGCCLPRPENRGPQDFIREAPVTVVAQPPMAAAAVVGASPPSDSDAEKPGPGVAADML